MDGSAQQPQGDDASPKAPALRFLRFVVYDQQYPNLLSVAVSDVVWETPLGEIPAEPLSETNPENGIVTASHTDSGYSPYSAYDLDVETQWRPGVREGSLPASLTLELPVATPPPSSVRIRVTQADRRAPRRLSLEASLDGQSWLLMLDTVVEDLWDAQARAFETKELRDQYLGVRWFELPHYTRWHFK